MKKRERWIGIRDEKNNYLSKILDKWRINDEEDEVVLEDETTIFSKKEYARCVQQIE